MAKPCYFWETFFKKAKFGWWSLLKGQIANELFNIFKIHALSLFFQTLTKSHDELIEKNSEIELTNADTLSDIEAETKRRDESIKIFDALSAENEERMKTTDNLSDHISRISRELQVLLSTYLLIETLSRWMKIL